MSKVTIIIDSDDDDDVVEILECAPSMRPLTPVKNASTKAVLPQNKEQHEPERATQTADNIPNVTTTKPAPRPQQTSSSKAFTSSNIEALSSKKQPPPPFVQSETLPKSTVVQPTKTITSSPIPAHSPSSSKAKVRPIPKPRALTRTPPKGPTTSKIHHNSPNPIPAPVVIYATEARPSEHHPPLNSINSLFQRDARTVILTKSSRRTSSGLSRNTSSVDISKKLEMDKELAAIFASNSPEPSPSTLVPSPTSTPIFSQTAQGSPSATMGKRPLISSSPPRQMHGSSSSSQEQRQNSLFSPNSLNSPPAPMRKRPIISPQNPSLFSRPEFIKKKVVYGVDDESGEEEDLELYINHVSSRRKLFSDELKEAERRRMGNKQCPLCYMMFPKQNIMDHSFECDGKPTDKGLKKRTIGTAVAINAAERKKKNAGVQDTGPTNYYADSDGALALDGSGFGSEVTGLTWESAGHTRFA
ncbi:hypothetical protein MAM1_0074d04266 [Mucor ambiguus]|uniref:Uncharacterized protein n=1 Tax=Mucor ambiguus TaxID=91626 RepID=A0A0C9M5I0_9FUNG|nr:hypothetical protein MAM1_0074d04266 [Mucor ambiguus]